MTSRSEVAPEKVGSGAAIWALAAAVLMAGGIAGAFWIAPDDVEGDIQKLLYLHVPLALVSPAFGGVVGHRPPKTRRELRRRGGDLHRARPALRGPHDHLRLHLGPGLLGHVVAVEDRAS